MASSDADEVLCSTPGRANFQRVSRLLVCGGTRVLRDIFDSIHPLSVLPTVLGNPAREKQLRGARLTKPQWDCLYPSPGVYGQSTDFDITLLSRLLRTICNLTPPPTGWDSLPASFDHSLPADLVRIKFYRNSVYGHVKENMEVTDDEFSSLWQDVSETIVRIAGNISPVKRNEWKKAIDGFLNDSLTLEDERNVQELRMWYYYDMDVKKAMEQLEVSCEEGINRVNTAVTREMEDVKEGMSRVETAVTREMEDAREEIKDVHEAVEGTSHDLETAVREEAQDIKDQLGHVQKSVDELSSFAGNSQTLGARLKVRIDCETIGLQSTDMVLTTQTHQAESYEEPPIPIAPKQRQVARTGSFQEENVSRQPFPSTQQVLNLIAQKYFEKYQIDGFIEYMTQARKVMVLNIEEGSLLITVECGSLEILEGLWEDYTSGHLSEVVQKLLVTPEILKELGLTSVKLKVTILKEEYKAGKQYFLQSAEGHMEVGLRVVRGPEWELNDTESDGGEGFVGTVVEVGGKSSSLPENLVSVQWDSGIRHDHRAGYYGAFDLLVLDNASAGIKHDGIECRSCKQNPILGMCWKCQDCDNNVNLCTSCYMADDHQKQHAFLRLDFPDQDGVSVGKRLGAKKVQSRGIFPGAKVVRGIDWRWKNQDGGEGKEGVVIELMNWKTSPKRGVLVSWDCAQKETYRLGAKGKVDLKCSQPGTGGFYYKDHLPKLGEGNFKLRRKETGAAGVATSYPTSEKANYNRPVAGDIDICEDIFNIFEDISKARNSDIDYKKPDLHILDGGAVSKEPKQTQPQLKCDDYVKILDDEEVVKQLQKSHGPWDDSFCKVLGQTGRILSFNSAGDVVVIVGPLGEENVITFNPTVLSLSSADEKEEDEKNQSGTSWHSSGVKADLLREDMSEEDEKEAKRMIVTSATRGKVQELEALLEMFPHMVDCTCQGHTGLHQACHHGHADAILSLLHRGASLTAQDFQGYTPLHHAAYGNDYTGSTAQLLISVGKEIDLNDARNEPCRSTPLALAVSRNNVGSAAVLIGAGCDVNAQDRNGLTPLHSAVLLGDMHMVHELLKAPSVNLKICDNQRMNPFLSAVNRKFHRAVEAMVTHSPNIVNVPEFGSLMTALHFSAVNDDVETALILLQTEKCDTRARNKNGQTALEQAISAENSSVMELLSSLETGAETRCSFQKLASGNHTKCQKGDVVLCVGDRVRLVDDKETLEVLQMGHGGYTFHMNLNLGKQAIVTDTLPGGDVRISTEQLGHQFVMNPAALELVESQQDNLGFPFNITPSDVPVYIDAQEMDDHSKAAALLSGAAGAGSLPVVQAVLERYPDVADQQCLDAGAVSSEPSYAQPQLKCYDYVKILDNEEIVKKLQKSHGPWDDSFCKVLGQTGRILSFNSEGDVEVIVGPSGEENIITFNPAVLSLSSADDKEENEKRQPDVRVYAYSQEMDDLSKAAALLSGAAGAGDLPVVEAVLERYPNVIDLLDQAGHTALHSACHQGHFEVVAFLVERGFSIELKDWQGYTALHHAAYSDRSGKTASVLVLQGANIDENQNEYGSTPLHLSIKEYNTETAKVLIQAGCNVNLPELNGFSALALAIFHGDADVVESLLDRPDLLLDLAGCPPFYSALTGKDCPETVKAIIQRFPKTARLPLDHDMTPLHFAALYDNVALAKFLLEKGEFDLNLKSKSGLTPITLAHMAGSESVMEVMQEQIYTNQQTSLGSRDPSLVAAIRSELLKLVSKSVSSRKTFYREFKFGDKVQVLGNRALVEAYQIGNGGWVDAMETVLRKFGHVEEVLENGNIRVCIQDPTAPVSLIFNPLCLDPAEGD